ncbi:hypothetical protein ACWDZ4_13695 [Streptomyces sp. NPDC003016]
MERENIPDPTESGLSTEDLAGPHGLGEAGEEPEGGPPAFPGESTAPAADADASTAPGQESVTAQGEDVPELLTTEDEERFRTRWQDVQNQFVDDPREAVHKADALVADVMQTLAATFADYKKDLEGQWKQGEEVDTEDLRKALRHYRSFFNRLLTT